MIVAVLLLVGVLDLVDHALVGGAGRVEPGLAGGVLVLVADLEVLVPVAFEQGRDLFTVGRETGRLEQVGAVADALRSDVGAVGDQATVGVSGRLGLPVDPPVGDSRVGEVGELVGVLHHLREPVDLDRLDVGEAAAGAELLEEVRAGVVRRGGLVVDDRDAGVGRFVLREQLVACSRSR